MSTARPLSLELPERAIPQTVSTFEREARDLRRQGLVGEELLTALGCAPTGRLIARTPEELEALLGGAPCAPST